MFNDLNKEFQSITWPLLTDRNRRVINTKLLKYLEKRCNIKFLSSWTVFSFFVGLFNFLALIKPKKVLPFPSANYMTTFLKEQMDVCTAYLNSDLKDKVYMKQPKEYVDNSQPDKVLLLKKKGHIWV